MVADAQVGINKAAEAAEAELKVKLQKTQTELEPAKQQNKAHELTVNAATAKAAEVLKEKPNLKAAAVKVAAPVEADEEYRNIERYRKGLAQRVSTANQHSAASNQDTTTSEGSPAQRVPPADQHSAAGTEDTPTSEGSPVVPTDPEAEDDSLNELLLQSKYSTSVRRQSLENAEQKAVDEIDEALLSHRQPSAKHSPRVEAESDMLMNQAQVDKSTEAAKAQVDIMHQRTVQAVQVEVAKLMRGGVVVEELNRAHQNTVEELAQAIKLAEEAASAHRGAENKLDAMHAATEAAVKLDLFNERPRPSGSPPRRRSPTRPLKTVDQLCVDARVSLTRSQSPTGPRPVV